MAKENVKPPQENNSRPARSSSKRGQNNTGVDLVWVVGNLNRIMADLAMYPPDMRQAWKVSHEGPRGRVLVEFHPVEPVES